MKKHKKIRKPMKAKTTIKGQGCGDTACGEGLCGGGFDGIPFGAGTFGPEVNNGVNA